MSLPSNPLLPSNPNLPSQAGGGLPSAPSATAAPLSPSESPAPVDIDLDEDYQAEEGAGDPNKAFEVQPRALNEAPQPAGRYMSIGQLTSDQLLQAEPGAFNHLQDVILSTKDWVQNVLTQQERTEDVIEARANKNSAKYHEMSMYLDSLILRKLQSDRLAMRGSDRPIIVASVINEIIGLGPLEPLWDDPAITEIIVTGPDRVVVEIGGRLRIVPGASFRDADHLLSLCQQILGAIGRRVDVQHPTEDGRLPDRSRVNVVHQAVAPNGPVLTIRRHREEAWTVQELIQMGSFTEEMATDLAFWIDAGCSTIVLGGTGTGKTTVLNALSGMFPASAYTITIEDNLELQLHPDRLVTSMEARPPSASGSGAVTIRDLVRNSLRMRPDRIVVGEVRGKEAFDMLQGMSTGHNGSMTTVHANGAFEAIDRLVSLVGQAGELDESGILSLISGAVDLLVVAERFAEDGSRRVSGVYEVPSRVSHVNGAQTLEPIPLWEFVHDSTDPVTNEVKGHYEKMNDVSDILARKHRLARRPYPTIEQVYESSQIKRKQEH